VSAAQMLCLSIFMGITSATGHGVPVIANTAHRSGDLCCCCRPRLLSFYCVGTLSKYLISWTKLCFQFCQCVNHIQHTLVPHSGKSREVPPELLDSIGAVLFDRSRIQQSFLAIYTIYEINVNQGVQGPW
jgi:hypothetical protein